MSRQVGEIKMLNEMTYFKSSESENSGVHDGTFRNKLKIKVRTVVDEKVTKSEVENFLKLNSHPNIQRLFGYEFRNSIHHFGLQSFDLTLEDFMKASKNKRIKIDPIFMVKDITEGLKYLHENKIIHGNLNFRNIRINKMTKRAVICNCGFDDLQEDQNIFIAPEEIQGDISTLKADIFTLGCIIYYTLSNGNHPFGSLKNPNGIIKNIKEKVFDPHYKEFKNLITGKALKSNYKIECAIYLLKSVLKKDPKRRTECAEMLEHPLFWSTYQIYKFFMEIKTSWNSLSEEDTKMFNEKGLKYFRMHTWTYQLKNCLKDVEYNPEERKSLVELVKFVTSKIKHYEDELFDKSLSSEHLYYLEEFPFLLPLVYKLNNEILKKEKKRLKAVNISEDSRSQSNHSGLSTINNTNSVLETDGTSSSSNEENKSLKELFLKHSLSLHLLISPSAVQTGRFIKKSNAEVYCGNFDGKEIAIKKINKNDFRINEIKCINRIITRGQISRGKQNNAKCKSCKKDECENVIKFYGCYEEENLYCLVLEKAEMDFTNFVESVKDEPDKDEKITKILFDVVKGLECIHKNDVPHLDLTPRNILIVKRQNELVGCLADFGESVEGIRKTYTKSKFRGTDGYIAPELLKVASQRKRRSTLNYREPKKDASLNWSKCDIYSLGKVIIRDYIEPETTDKTSTSRSLYNLRQKGEISFLCEELANSLTEADPTKRPDAEGVRKNPFFWREAEKKIQFLKSVDEYRNRHETDPKIIEDIEILYSKALKRLSKTDWMEYFSDNKDIQSEIINYLKVKKKDSTSIFDLVELILFIIAPESAQILPQTREKLLNPSELQAYLSYFFKKFEIIPFLYYGMQDDFKILYPEYYSSETPKRSMARRRLTTDERPKRKRKLSTSSETAGEMSFRGNFKIPKISKI